MIIFPTSANPALSGRVAELMGAKISSCQISKFSDGEPRFQITARLLPGPYAVFGSLNQPETNIREMLWTLNAVKHWSGQGARAVIPYLGYSRQDRSEPKGTAVSAELVAGFLSAAGANGVMAIDVHSPRVINYYTIPFINISSASLFAGQLKKINTADLVLAAPDEGAGERVREVAKLLNHKDIAVVKKRRDPIAGRVRALEFDGDVKGKNICFIDDMIDTGGTLMEAAKLLKSAGAKKFMAVATHGIFSSNAFGNLQKSGFEKILTTDTIARPKPPKFVTVVSVAALLAKELARSN
ncbi:ribose-phosphate pyrophosphokinase [Candidatus Uhrbacteria bacterium]|nr:ribose-phosphate pyrophosphokinase [Candidatus Uhrbacteria bacterium]